jgi:hypothetical protein
MANTGKEKKPTSIYQALVKTLTGWDSGEYNTQVKSSHPHTYNYNDPIILKTKDKSEYDAALLQGQQDKWLSTAWVHAQARGGMKDLQSMGYVDLMYRDIENMCQRPEIYQALNISASEVCTIGNDGSLINITSKSERIKFILEDLFVNRLQIHLELLPLVRTMLKYGNEYKLLNIQSRNGILGWHSVPVTEMRRFQSLHPYGVMPQTTGKTNEDISQLQPHFEYLGAGSPQSFHSWQVAHFRLMNDTICSPYGASYLNGARQQWRRLMLAEDHMLIYMMEKAYDRLMYKIDIGLIDANDVEAYIQEIANRFKRTSRFDPQTGQLDLSKNCLSPMDDFFIPVRGDRDASKIEVLNGSSSFEKFKDVLEYLHLQMLTALGIPKVFLNFEASPSEGRTLSMTDIRFAKLMTRIQQCVILELNKIAIIHLYLLGFEDDLNNFTITMNNPSTQVEILRIEETQKKILACKDAISATDAGISIYSWKKALREIMKFSDAEISQILEDLRYEKAVATELSLTQQIIKKTGAFDKVDTLYGEPNAQYDYSVTEMGQAEAQAGGAGGGGGGGDMSMGDMTGGEAGADPNAAAGDPNAAAPGAETGAAESAPMESRYNRNNLITENITVQTKPTYTGSPVINEEFENIIARIDEYLNNSQEII